MLTRTRLIGVIASAAAVLVLTAAPAAARPGPASGDATHSASPPAVTWTYPPCMRATVSSVAWEPGVAMFVVSGAAARCRTLWTLPGVAAGYRIATYVPGEPTARAPGHNVRLFPGGAALEEQIPYGAAAIPQQVGTYGVCVVGNTRQACAEVTVTTDAENDHHAVLRPVSTSAALVQLPLDARPYTGSPCPPGGFCGTCF